MKNAKKNDGGNEKVIRLGTRLKSGEIRAVIVGGDGNSRNYAAGARWSQDRASS